MKTYRLWYDLGVDAGYPSEQKPHTFDTLEDAQVEMVKRIFNIGHQYKIVESEDQQS